MASDIRRKLTSLHGLLHPERFEDPPDMLFAIVPTYKAPSSKDDLPTISLTVESFARLDSLPKELADQVRSFLKEQGTPKKVLHYDTMKELADRDANEQARLRKAIDEARGPIPVRTTLVQSPDNPFFQGQEELCPSCDSRHLCEYPPNLERVTEERQKDQPGSKVIVTQCDGVPRKWWNE